MLRDGLTFGGAPRGARREKVRTRLAAGGKEIRTLGPAVEERPFRRAPYGFFRGNLQNVRSLPMTIRHRRPKHYASPDKGPRVRIMLPPAASPVQTVHAGSNDARPSRPLGRCGASVREIGGGLIANTPIRMPSNSSWSRTLASRRCWTATGIGRVFPWPPLWPCRFGRR
jgi:hypothetical protein